MREIKFKVFNNNKKRWEGSDVLFFNQQNLPIIEIERIKSGLEIVLYTGLTDKSGKEIYEGDICKVLEEQYKWLERKKTFEVKWSKGMTGFNPFRNHSYLENHCEVIGNIYENPELLTP